MKRLILVFVVVAGCGGVADNGGTASQSTATQGITFVDADPAFAAQGQACITQIQGFGGFGAMLISSLQSIPVKVTKGTSDSSSTYNTAPNEPTTIDWSTASGTYTCSGAPKVPCATLIHELTHAQEFYQGTASRQPLPNAADEWSAVRAENWLLSQLGLCQRTCYDTDTSPSGIAAPGSAMVLWPDAAGTQEVRVPTAANDGSMMCVVEPTVLTLTVDNQSPDQILVSGDSNALLCGGQNQYFDATTTARNCTLQIANDPSNNPYAVPLITLVAFLPSGDPDFVGGGMVKWTYGGTTGACGGNAYSTDCQIAMGINGSLMTPLVLAQPMSETVQVEYITQ